MATKILNNLILEFLLLPFIIAIVYLIAYRIRNRRYPKGHPWRKYFIPALSLKIFGAIFIGLVYAFYYGKGDTFNYFYHSQVINSAFDESIYKWLNLVFHTPSLYDARYYEYTSQMFWYTSSSYTVASIGAILGIFTMTTYFSTSVLFAFVSFSGIWALFRTFASLYPKYTKQLAVCILFIPSVFVWGSGIFKDTICLFGLGWLTYGCFRILINREFKLSNIILTILSFILIYKVKVYILVAFVPALVMWIQFSYTKKIRIAGVRILVKLSLLALLIIGVPFVMNRFSSELGRYSLENLLNTSTVTRTWILKKSGDEGSGYDLGTFDPSVSGMLSKLPLAVNVTLFRPYLWEANNILILMSALEAFLFLLITLRLLMHIGLKRIFSSINKDPNLQFCFVFAIIFAFAVGISTYNFGSLSRYKIPCLPFYLIPVVLIYYQNAKPGQRLLGKWL